MQASPQTYAFGVNHQQFSKLDRGVRVVCDNVDSSCTKCVRKLNTDTETDVDTDTQKTRMRVSGTDGLAFNVYIHIQETLS